MNVNAEWFAPDDGWSLEWHRSDKYDIQSFARDDFQQFLTLVDLLSPRDAEIMLCYAVLQKRPTDLSILFGKAGHRAEEDLHKAAHKLAGLIEFRELPDIERIGEILERQNLQAFNSRSLAACLWQYARSRDFVELTRLAGTGLRQHMLRTFRTLHASEGREEGLLAGWILWLVDGSNPRGAGWRPRKRGGYNVLGPTTFSTFVANPEQLQLARRATQSGGQGKRTKEVRVKRKIKFLLRNANA